MHAPRYCFGLAIAAALVPVHTSAADSTTASVNAHLSAISWFSGTYRCTGRATYSNGKVSMATSTITIAKAKNGWMQAALKGQPGFTDFGYDPKKNRFVFVSTSGPGEYAAGYFTVAADRSIVMEFPDILDNDVYFAGDFQKYTPTSNGYNATGSGPSDRYPDTHYRLTSTCARQ
jgi:hypothetical protein